MAPGIKSVSMNHNDRHSKVILWACYLAAAMVLMDLTSVNIALPTISKYYELDLTQVSWLLMASMLSATSFTIIAGRIVDVYEAPIILFVGFVIFLIGTISCFFVDSFEILIGIRFIQGFGEALLYVVGPAYIRRQLPYEQQQGSYGIWMASTAVGISMGPLLGGLLVSGFGWHSVFLINTTLSMMGVIVLLSFGLVNRPLKHKVSNIDYYGAVFSFLALASLILTIDSSSKNGLNDGLFLMAFTLFLVFLILFIYQEKRSENPVFDIKIFRLRNFNIAAIGFFLFFLVNVGSRFLRPFYFENIKHIQPAYSGILMMVSPLIMLVVSTFSEKISRIVNRKMIVIVASLLLAGSMFWFSRWDRQTSVFELVMAMIVLGLSMGLYYPVNSFIGMQSLPITKSGMGSAAISGSKSMGKLMGVLLFSFCFSLISSNLKPESDQINIAFQSTFLVGAVIALLITVLSFKIRKIE